LSEISGQRRGGLVRKERLTPARRTEIAVRAAQARWNRETPSANLINVEDFQMGTDPIDAADILVTELSEQAALLSESGVNALTSGYLGDARLIINAIEQTHALRDRAEQLKRDIADLYSSLVPSEHGEGDARAVLTDSVGIEARKQDRTDPVLMNGKRNQIIRKLENVHGVRLHRRSAAIYRSDDEEINIVCTMSKWHMKNEIYWYAYHPHQDDILGASKKGYFVLGMMDMECAVVLPVEVIRGTLPKLNTTTAPDGRRYWHIHISRADNGGLWLLRARGEPPLSVNRYLVEISDRRSM
jgi:hypothetical protein